ncbi:MAG: hypothetical protein CMJ18_05395 [Phycisphaeraceae bacterium]|nr:hypothetical protein [Phycisphaeraceae bacterium]
MNVATGILLLMLSNQGHWFGGTPGTVTVRYAAASEMPPATLTWVLSIGDAEVSRGRKAMPANGEPMRLELTPPRVRVPTEMSWHWRLLRDDTSKQAGAGRAAVIVYPDNLLERAVRRTADRRLFVCDRTGKLTSLLRERRIRAVASERPHQVRAPAGSVILVGAGTLTGSTFEQGPLLAHARSGSSVMIFAQSAPRVAGYALAPHDTLSGLTWRRDHPLLEGMEDRALTGWFDAADLRIVRLPADEPALEIAWFAPTVKADRPVPIDALLVTRAIGKGRLVLCQVPLGSWLEDPRAQMLLDNAITYLGTRPEPTPRPSRRAAEFESKAARPSG